MSARKVLMMLTVAVLAVSVPASAAIYTVYLTSGRSIETRYQPMQSPSDEGKMMLLTAFGNWISMPKSAVTKIEIDLESRGFGSVLDTLTVHLGMSLNDAAEAGEGGTQDPTAAYMQYLQQRDAAAANYTVQQFVEPNEAGGIPLSFTQTTTPPLGSPGRFLTPQDR